MKLFITALIAVIMSFSAVAQNVGIGTLTPAYKLDVAGVIRASANCYINGYLGVNTTNPLYSLQVNNGSIAIYNTADAKTWYFNYSSDAGYFQLSEGGIARLVVANGGNVGIGTTSPAAKLDVSGNAVVSSSLAVGGAATVNNGKGVLYNAANSNNLRYYTRTAAFSVVNLAPLGISSESSIGFSGFTQAPQVFVGNIVSTGGTAGQLYKCQLIIYDVTASGCKCRISNTSNTTLSQDITWNISCIGR
jgi:hypothetical protein